MITRIIPIPPVKDCRPNDPQGTEEHERETPVDELEHCHDQQRSESSAPASSSPEEPLGARPLPRWQPGSEGLRDDRETTGFTDAEQKPDDHQRRETPSPSRQRSEGRPAEHD